MSTIYKQLEKIVLPSLVNFKEDLTKYDKETISNNKGTKFLYAFRPNGTNILMLDPRRFIRPSGKSVEKSLKDSFEILKGYNKTYLYFNGESLEQINHETLCGIYGMFAKEVRAFNEHIAALNIDMLAIDIYCTMTKYQKSWKTVLCESVGSSSMTIIQKNFNVKKLKKPDDFSCSTVYADIKHSKELKDIKQQLLDNLIY